MRVLGGIITIVEGILLTIVFGKSMNDGITRDMDSVVAWIVFLGIILVVTGIIGLMSRKKNNSSVLVYSRWDIVSFARGGFKSVVCNSNSISYFSDEYFSGNFVFS